VLPEQWSVIGAHEPAGHMSSTQHVPACVLPFGSSIMPL
jgi:hypothetical protein